MNNSGIIGDSNNRVVAARKACGGHSWFRRSPNARLPIWSWFCRNSTKAVGGKCPLGSPRGRPLRSGWPWKTKPWLRQRASFSMVDSL
ncbi:hypothetical protein D3C76_1426090 [compost metagenome]